MSHKGLLFANAPGLGRFASDHRAFGQRNSRARSDQAILRKRGGFMRSARRSSESVGYFVQPVLQSSFIFDKAKQDSGVIRENPSHLRRYPEWPLPQPKEVVMPNTVRLHRVLAAKPEKIYRAFVEPDAVAKWLPPNGFTCTVHQMDAKVGGSHRMSFRNFTTGHSHAFGGKYVELIPNERLRYTDKFEDPNLPGEMQVTVTLKAVSVGTEVNIVQEGVPDVIR